jgi:NADPH:quinone reductase-like Zn-dependent oxidoreductase
VRAGEADAMKAVVYERYEYPDVLELRDIDRPTVTDDGVLVRIRAATADLHDEHLMHAEVL